MKSYMTMKVSFMAGTTIKQAIEEAKEKAITMNLAYVTFDFNGVSVSIQQGCDVYSTSALVMEAMKNDDKYVIGARGYE